MQRRTILLCALFVVTAWFYSSMAQSPTETVAQKHQQQLQMLERAEEALDGGPAAGDPDKD